MSAILEAGLDPARKAQADAFDRMAGLSVMPKSAAAEIGELRLALARANQRNADLLDELQTAVNECCNDYWIKGHGARVRLVYGVEHQAVTMPDVMDTVRLAHAALTGKADAKAAIAQC